MGDSRMRQFYKAFIDFAETGAKPSEFFLFWVIYNIWHGIDIIFSGGYGKGGYGHIFMNWSSPITHTLVEFHWAPEPTSIAKAVCRYFTPNLTVTMISVYIEISQKSFGRKRKGWISGKQFRKFRKPKLAKRDNFCRKGQSRPKEGYLGQFLA